MRRSSWTRTLAAIFAVWLALVLGDAGFVHHHCPMHDGALATATGSGAHAGGHATHGEPGDHRSPSPDGHHGCSCIGACSASSGAITLGTRPELPLATITSVASAAPSRDADSAPSQRPPFTLPFANGPPLPQRIA